MIAVASLFESLKCIAKSALRPAHLPAIIALVVIILLGAFADRQNATLSDQRRLLS